MMMEKLGMGNIQVRLYGRPTQNLIRDAYFLTRPCSPVAGTPSIHQCSDEKWSSILKELAQISDRDFTSDYFSGLFLSGLSGKSPLALKASLLMGQQIDLAKYKEGAPASTEDKKNLLEFFKLVYEAKMKNSLSAALKVKIALAMHGEQLNPLMNEIFGRLPLSQMEKSSFKDWEHISDYTHHKLLAVGDRFFQLGGRNIENSYHMKKNGLSAKYTFIDTDFAATVSQGGEKIAQAYDQLWDFTEMTASIRDIYRLAPNDFSMNPQAAGVTLYQCSQKPNKTPEDRKALEQCLSEGLWKNGGKTLADRMISREEEMMKEMKIYQTEYLPKRVLPSNWKSDPQYTFEISSQDRNQMTLAYLENLHYDKRKPVSDRKRLFGAFNGQELLPMHGNELAYGKNIHHLWLKGLENACATSAKDNQPKRVILHSAYFLPPANMVRTFAKMMDGTWDCHNVHVTFLTNSFETTDLNVINIYARYEMKSFFDIYATRKGHFGEYAEKRSAKFDYFEYIPARSQNGEIDKDRKISLHTKVTVLGDDIIIGSANSDVRSFYMDTNNGIYLRNAKDFAKEYTHWVESILADTTQTRNLTPDHLNGNISLDKLFKEDEYLMNAIMVRFKLDGRLSPEAKKRAQEIQRSFGQSIDTAIKQLLSKDYIEYYGEEQFAVDREKIKLQREVEARFNRALQAF